MPKLLKKIAKKNKIHIISNLIRFYDNKGNFYKITLKNKFIMIGHYISKNNIRFDGEWIKSKYDGKDMFIQHKGTWLWPNGDWFSGYFKNGFHSDGQGKKSIADVSSFYGVWKNGLPYSGRIVWKNHNWFEGFIFNKRPYNGCGYLKLDDNIFYAGTFKKGFLYNGECKYYSNDKTYYFEGKIKKGKMWEGKKISTISNDISFIRDGNEITGLDILSEVAYNLKN